MSSNSSIEWTDHTFNPWWGCTKVHSGCANCYAESLDHRWGGDHWGPKSARRMVLGEWGKPARWNEEARAAGVMRRVFCASMCDLFEAFDGPVVDQQDKPIRVPGGSADEFWNVPRLRDRVFELIEKTPHLLWLLLTKRPENIRGMVPTAWMKQWPANVMTGTSPCDQATADKSIPELLSVPGMHFLSCEPLLGAIEFSDVTGRSDAVAQLGKKSLDGIHWVIVGCESLNKRPGRNAIEYPMHALDLINQCRAAEVPVFHKQTHINGKVTGDMQQWPNALRVREMPTNTDLTTAPTP